MCQNMVETERNGCNIWRINLHCRVWNNLLSKVAGVWVSVLMLLGYFRDFFSNFLCCQLVQPFMLQYWWKLVLLIWSVSACICHFSAQWQTPMSTTIDICHILSAGGCYFFSPMFFVWNSVNTSGMDGWQVPGMDGQHKSGVEGWQTPGTEG